MDHPDTIPEMEGHPVDTFELVLRARCPPKESSRGPNFKVKAFGERFKANQALKDEHRPLELGIVGL